MKKKLFLLIVSMSVISCNTDNEVTNQNYELDTNSNLAYRIGKTPELKTFKLDNGQNVEILSFSSWQDFQNLASDLDYQVEIFDDNYLKENSNLTIDQLNILEETNNYNDQEPLINFEKNINFNQALRNRFNIENEMMLSTNDLDPNLDPNINLAFSGGEMSLVNDNQEVIVADTIYIFKNGIVGRIYSNFNENLLKFRGNDLTNLKGVLLYEPNLQAAECVGWKATESDHHYANNKNARRVAKIRAVPGYTKSEKMTINYEKKNRWKETRTKMALDLSVWLYRNCDSNSTTQGGTAFHHGRNTFKDKKRRDIHDHQFPNSGTYKTRVGFLVGNHYYAGISTYYKLQ